MTASGQTLGLDLASTDTVFLSLLAVHVLAAIVAIVMGLRAMLTSKAGRHHPATGRIYGIALVVVFLTACGMSAFRWPTDAPLVVLGGAAVLAAGYGYLFRRLHHPGHVPHIIAMGASYVLMLTAFYVDNGPHLPIWQLLPNWSFWFIPALVGVPLIIRSALRYRHRTDIERPRKVGMRGHLQ